MAGKAAQRLLWVLGGLLLAAGLLVALLPEIGRTEAVQRFLVRRRVALDGVRRRDR